MAIVKANSLIETSYHLGSREQFFILFVISKLDSINNKEFSNFKVHYKDIVKILNFDGKRRVANTGDVFKIMRNLNKSPIQFEDEEIREESVWITSLRENKKEGTFSFTFPEALKPFLIELKEKFTKYNIKNIVNLNSHALRMYEILKRYEYEESVVLDVDKQLKKWLGIENKYSEYFEFKRCILIKSQKQLKKYTDISFTFETAKKDGRKITALKFTITKNEPSSQPKSLEKLQQITIEGQHKPRKKDNLSKGNRVGDDTTKHKDKLSVLSRSQKITYDFLEGKGINRAFIIDKILTHPKLNYEPLVGFEDMYIRVVWAFFKKKTNSSNLAPTFVTWWKNDRLTEPGLHARHLENVMELKNRLSSDDKGLRYASKNMTFTEFEEYKENINKSSSIQSTDLIKDLASKVRMPKNEETFTSSKKKAFDFGQFKKDYPQIYQQEYNVILSEFKENCQKAGFPFDKNKFEKSIVGSTIEKCKQWLENQK
jgi:plasmid replication initiation protein